MPRLSQTATVDAADDPGANDDDSHYVFRQLRKVGSHWMSELCTSQSASTSGDGQVVSRLDRRRSVVVHRSS